MNESKVMEITHPLIAKIAKFVTEQLKVAVEQYDKQEVFCIEIKLCPKKIHCDKSDCARCRMFDAIRLTVESNREDDLAHKFWQLLYGIFITNEQPENTKWLKFWFNKNFRPWRIKTVERRKQIWDKWWKENNVPPAPFVPQPTASTNHPSSPNQSNPQR
jgi:hypothetical protein